MQVKMRTRYASPSGTCAPGGLIDLPDDEAKTLITEGFATDPKAKPALHPKQIEKAAQAQAAADAKQAEADAAAESDSPQSDESDDAAAPTDAKPKKPGKHK